MIGGPPEILSYLFMNLCRPKIIHIVHCIIYIFLYEVYFFESHPWKWHKVLLYVIFFWINGIHLQ